MVNNRPIPHTTQKGFSQAELMITLALLAVGFLAAVGAFKGMAQGIFITKAKSLAVNLAQEKVEFLKDKSYYRLRVSSNIVAAALVGIAVDSDPVNYPEERLNVGGIPYWRYAVVRKVRKAAGSSNLETVPWSDPDTGLKKVSIAVVWKEGADWKKINLENVRENPNRSGNNVTIRGSVKDSLGTDIAGAIVEVAENPSWRSETNTSGEYTFNLLQGTWTVRASSTPYFTVTQPGKSVDTQNTPLTVDFTGSTGLPKRSSGTVDGYLWLRDHLVISQVVGSSVSSTGFDQEWVEIYNPTTYTWTMATAANAAVIGIAYQEGSGGVNPMQVIGDIPGEVSYNTLTLAPNSYFLFANTSPVEAAGVTRNADAVYGYDALVLSPNVIRVKDEGGGLGTDAGVGLGWFATLEGMDAVGWKVGGGAPPDMCQGLPIPQNNGLEGEEQFVRMTSTSGIIDGDGRAYNSGSNSRDFMKYKPINRPPRNSSDSELPVAGTPAIGAYVFAGDGLSGPAVATGSGTIPTAYFKVTSVATGSWTMYSSSGTNYNSIPITVSAGSNQTVTLHLTTYTASGYVTGRVTTIGGTALPGILVDPGGVPADAVGYYRLTTSTGSVDVTANPNSTNSSYVELSSNVTVGAGQLVSNVNFSLSGGGRIRGKVTSDGTNALPDIPVSIMNSGTSIEVDNVLSASDGTFQVSVPTATYLVTPIGESGEVVTPASTTVTVASGGNVFSSVFTVGPALGTVAGNVTAGGQNITTGVLIVVTTETIVTPPILDNALRSSGKLYYVGSSAADGTYSIDVRAGTYNVYGWYTTFSGQTPSFTPKNRTGVVVNPGIITTNQDLSW